jgi:hypothetical protein
MYNRKTIIPLLIAFGGITAPLKALDSIGWIYDRSGTADDVLVTDTVGAPPYAQVNWNKHTGTASQTAGAVPFTLMNNSGVTTTAQVTAITGTTTNAGWSGGPNSTPDERLFHSYWGKEAHVTFAGIPADYQENSYKVVAYFRGSGALTVSITGSVNDSKTSSITIATYETAGVGYREAVPGSTSGSYTVISGLDDPSFTIALSNTSGLCAVQIVKDEGPPAAPSLPTPLDDEFGDYPIALSSGFSWTASKRATSYDVFLWKADDPEPTEPVATTLTASYTPSSLEPLTEYLWKVEAVGLTGRTAGDTWHFITGDGGPPGEPSDPYPLDGTEYVPLNAGLSWEPSANAASYEVYLWLSSDPKPEEPTWTLTSTLIPSTTLEAAAEYLWQVVAVNGAERTESQVWTFSTTDFFNAGRNSIGWNYDHPSRSNDNLTAADGAGAPGFGQLNWNNHTGSGNGPGTLPFALKDSLGATTTAQVTAWTVDGAPNGYSYGYAGSQTNGKMMNSYIGNVPSITFSNIPAAYQTSGYSVVVYFNPGSSGGTVSLTGSVNDSRSVAISSGITTSSWEATGFVNGVNYTVFTGANDPTFTLDSTLRGIIAVQVVQESGAPALATNPFPTDQATDVAVGGDITWDSAPRALTYDVYLWKTSDPTPETPSATGLSTALYSIPDVLEPSTNYSWRVDSVNVSGTTTGTVWTFTTGDAIAPDQVTNAAPLASATEVALLPTFGWSAAARASSYELFVWESTEEAPGSATASTATPGHTLTSPLTGGITYSWRVDAVNTFGRTTGEVWSFTTGFPPLQASAPTPAHEATGQQRQVKLLNWSDVEDATSYQVFLWASGGTEPLTPTAVTTASEYLPISLLAANTTYFWRVNPVNAFGTTTGDLWSFTTGSMVSSQESIGWNYDHPSYSNDTLAASDIAGKGQYAQANWNNHTGNGNGPAQPATLPFALKDNLGNATTAQITEWTTTAANGYRRAIVDGDPNNVLTNSYIRNAPSITFSNLPESYSTNGYQVVVYYSSVAGTQSITLTGSVDDSRTLDITTPVAGNAFYSSYCEVFTDLNDPSITVATTAGFYAIQIIKNPGATEDGSFDAWAARMDLAGENAAFDADPDGDGIDNGLEFLLGGLPNSTQPGSNSRNLLPTVEASGDNLVFTFTRVHEAADLVAVVEFSPTLDSDEWIEATELNATIDIDEGEESDTVTVTIPKGEEQKLFARLRVLDPTLVP